MRGVYDFKVTLQIEDRTCIGRGTAIGEELAFIKAGAEAIERAICHHNRISTVGVAVHVDEVKCRASAHSELIERDSFFCHYYSRTPFAVLNDVAILNLRNQFPQVFEQTEANGYQWRLFTSGRTGRPTVICLVTGMNAEVPFGGIIGLGRGNSLAGSVQKSFFECARNVASHFFKEEANFSLSIEEFHKIQNTGSFDRQKLARNLDYWKQVSRLFASETTKVQIASELPQTVLERMTALPPEFASAPIVAFRSALDPKYGRGGFGSEVPTTLLRLSEFTGITLTPDDFNSGSINPLPHFLG